MTRPEHTDMYSCPMGAACSRALLLADLELLAKYGARLAADWDGRHVVHVGHLAEHAATVARAIETGRDDSGTPICGGGH